MVNQHDWKSSQLWFSFVVFGVTSLLLLADKITVNAWTWATGAALILYGGRRIAQSIFGKPCPPTA